MLNEKKKTELEFRVHKQVVHETSVIPFGCIHSKHVCFRQRWTVYRLWKSERWTISCWSRVVISSTTQVQTKEFSPRGLLFYQQEWTTWRVEMGWHLDLRWCPSFRVEIEPWRSWIPFPILLITVWRLWIWPNMSLYKLYEDRASKDAVLGPAFWGPQQH